MRISYRYRCLSYLSFQVGACCILLVSPQHSLLLQHTHGLIHPSSVIITELPEHVYRRRLRVLSGRNQWIISCKDSPPKSANKMAEEMLRVLDGSRLPHSLGILPGESLIGVSLLASGIFMVKPWVGYWEDRNILLHTHHLDMDVWPLASPLCRSEQSLRFKSHENRRNHSLYTQ